LYLLKGKAVFLYNFLDVERFRWEGQQALARESTPSSSISPTTGPGLARAALAC
jgi:arylsulfatase